MRYESKCRLDQSIHHRRLGNVRVRARGIVGFLRTRPAGRQWREFVAGGAIAIGYLLAMVWTVGPPEGVEHIKQAFGLR